AVAFSPDGRLLAQADQELHLWDLATGKETTTLNGNQGRVNAVAFSPDGRLLAAAGSGTTVLLWDVAAVRKKLAEVKLDEKELGGKWGDLGSSDGAKAGKAIAELAARPDLAVSLLKDKLRKAAPLDARAVEKLVAKLDADAFA